MKAIRYTLTALSLCGLPGLAAAQAPVAATPPADEALRVFIDCQTMCDTEFTRREITYINWVRDRADADVHLIITSQSTGGGGREYNLRYIGLRAFRGVDDELKFSTRQSDSEDEVRQQLNRRIGMGLARYTVRGVHADRLQVTYTAPAGGAAGAVQKPRDPWNLWVFRLSASGSLSSESQYKSNRISGSLRASRVSERWKFQLSGSANRNNSTYTLSDSTEYKTHVSRYNGFLQLVRSISDHWSAGVDLEAGRSTRDNYDVNLTGQAGLEYDVFPYKESSKRQMIFVYQVGMAHTNYRDTTIYNKLVETRPQHSLTAAAEATQPWGSLSFSLSASSFLDDFSKNRFSVFGFCSVRLIRGFNINFDAGYSRIRDQISLVKAGLTDQEILLQLKQLRTDYNYFGSVSLSYTFGSKFNNIVNPRFTHSGGGGGSCFCSGGSCFCN